MSKCDPYFQFPLSLLQHAKSTPDVIQDACTLSMLTYGESMDDDVRQQVADEYAGRVPDDDDDCLAIAAGAVRLHVNVIDIAAEAVNARKLQRKYGDSGMQVRLRTDIAWSAHDDDWSLPKLRTLCAIYAGIGNRHTRQMTKLLLRAHAYGHASPKRLTENQMMSLNTFRYWAEQLWFKNLFQMCLCGRETWYSNSCKNDAELARMIKAQKCSQKTKTII